MEAQVRKVQTDAAVNIAKVQDMSEVEPQLRVAELQSKIQQKTQELELRRELAELTNSTRRGQAETNAATRIAATAMQTAAKKAQQPKQVKIPNARVPENFQ